MAYQDPATVKLENGRSMADVIRRDRYGLRGVVIAPATAGGTPVNFDPHDASKTQINVVDPDGKNLYGMTLDQITDDRVQAASAIATEKYPGDDIDSIRERAAMVFEELARMTSSGVVKVQKTSPVKTKTARVVVEQPAIEDDDETDLVDELQEEINVGRTVTPPIEKIDRNYSPMAAFGLKKRSPAPAQLQAHAGNSKTAHVGPPQKLVYFEKEGIGMVPAFFHDIIVSTAPNDDDGLEESGFMVLIYDLRFEQNAARWFPPANDPYQRPWAVQINDAAKLYLVHTTGFQYIYDSREYCVLMIERAVVSAGM